MKHFIGKQRFDIQAGASEDATALTNQLSKLYWQRIVPELERLFDELADEEEVFRVDRLEIDLGNLSEEQLLEGKFLDELRRLLKEELSRLIAARKVKSEKFSLGESHFEKWLFFLAHGYLPWNIPQPGEQWLADVLDTLAAQTKAVEELRQLVLGSGPARERLVLQHSRTFLKTVVELYTGISQDRLAEAAEEFYRLEERGRLPLPKWLLVKASARQLELYFWESVIVRLMQSREKPAPPELIRWFFQAHYSPSALAPLMEEEARKIAPGLAQALEGLALPAKTPLQETPPGKRPEGRKEEEPDGKIKAGGGETSEQAPDIELKKEEPVAKEQLKQKKAGEQESPEAEGEKSLPELKTGAPERKGKAEDEKELPAPKQEKVPEEEPRKRRKSKSEEQEKTAATGPAEGSPEPPPAEKERQTGPEEEAPAAEKKPAPEKTEDGPQAEGRQMEETGDEQPALKKEEPGSEPESPEAEAPGPEAEKAGEKAREKPAESIVEPAGKEPEAEGLPGTQAPEPEKAEGPQEPESRKQPESTEAETPEPKKKKALEEAREKRAEPAESPELTKEDKGRKKATEEEEKKEASKKEIGEEEPAPETRVKSEGQEEPLPEGKKEKAPQEKAPAADKPGRQEEEKPEPEAPRTKEKPAEPEMAGKGPEKEVEAAVPETSSERPVEPEEKEPPAEVSEEAEEHPAADTGKEEAIAETPAGKEKDAGAPEAKRKKGKKRLAPEEEAAGEEAGREKEEQPSEIAKETSAEEAGPEQPVEEAELHELPSYLQESKAPQYYTPKKGEEIYVENAGLVLAHPFLPIYFEKLNLLKDRKFRNEAARRRAVRLLHFLAVGDVEMQEYELALPKLMCELPLNIPIDLSDKLSDEEKEEGIAMLEALISHWGALKSTSPDGLREGFLRREGKLAYSDSGWELSVEQKAMDILLDRLPWGIHIIKLPWMKNMLKVHWR